MSVETLQRAETGFSLIELIIAVLIIAIIATVSVPAIQQNLRIWRLEAAANLITSNLTRVRMEAIKRNRTVRMDFDATDRRMTINTTDMAGNPITLGAAMTLPDEITFDGTPPASIAFTSLGRNVSAGESTVRLKTVSAAHIKKVVVAATGNIDAVNE